MIGHVCESNAPVDDPSHALSQPLFTIAVSRRKDQVWTEKREAELQRALMKRDTIIRNWPDAWRCKRELVACSTVNESMNLLGGLFVRESTIDTCETGKQHGLFTHYFATVRIFSGLLASLTCTESLRRCIHRVTALAV